MERDREAGASALLAEMRAALEPHGFTFSNDCVGLSGVYLGQVSKIRVRSANRRPWWCADYSIFPMEEDRNFRDWRFCFANTLRAHLGDFSARALLIAISNTDPAFKPIIHEVFTQADNDP